MGFHKIKKFLYIKGKLSEVTDYKADRLPHKVYKEFSLTHTI